MKPVLKNITVFLLSTVATGALAADDPSGIGLGVKAGTTGFGLDLTFPVSPSFNIRIGGTKYSLDRSMSESDVDYDARVRLGTVSVLADWHPFDGNFRLTTGLMRNNTRFDLTAKPSANATYTFNDVTYSASDIGSATARVAFSKSPAPYFGVGWGNASSGMALGLTVEFGVVWQHAPTARLDVICSDSLRAMSPETCVQLKADAQEEQSELEDALKDLQGFPVISLGLSYRF